MSIPNTTVDPAAVYQLRKFWHDNTPRYTQIPGPIDGDGATDQEIRDLLIFAARLAGPDLTLPLHLEAHRVIRLVPEEVGAALFEDIA